MECGGLPPGGGPRSRHGRLGPRTSAGVPSVVTEHLAAGPAELSGQEIRERMTGNLCRCGAYNGIVESIQEVASGDLDLLEGAR
ncbi:2Fe-2S iron-sulfur cluster-binding protein [Pseudonocardia sp. CA-142604]|uniref:2Fe-2S iron-sulfur cluster-binding protein n=1 Tax=Pseudonocardia sp. CA-142604 TaxID=3240024 RepID=UPI003D8B6D65